MKKNSLQSICVVIAVLVSMNAQSQCASASNIYTFTYDGATYEVIKENKDWVDAAACAVERGGILAEINDLGEQNAIYTELSTNAGISVNNTVAPDGGGASYIWIGGTDVMMEGEWLWDGDNDASGPQFWQGLANGSVVGGLYNNWGNEPDDFGSGQDGLGLAITDWPLGVSGQWNDISVTNTLYFVVEYPSTASSSNLELNEGVHIYPNPAKEILSVKLTDGKSLASITLVNVTGTVVKTITQDIAETTDIDVSGIAPGTYLISGFFTDGDFFSKEIIIE
ncbi:MAG: T9SS type A sorting domain-containing protein [Crocinitomicaceae bacterium]|nr:T9SS type A sorting domain-containing protein [Crocinitomicaceae bacterium]